MLRFLAGLLLIVGGIIGLWKGIDAPPNNVALIVVGIIAIIIGIFVWGGRGLIDFLSELPIVFWLPD